MYLLHAQETWKDSARENLESGRARAALTRSELALGFPCGRLAGPRLSPGPPGGISPWKSQNTGCCVTPSPSVLTRKHNKEAITGLRSPGPLGLAGPIHLFPSVFGNLA